METPEKGLSVLTWNFVERREKRRSKERVGGTAVLTLLPAITVTVSTKAEMSEVWSWICLLPTFGTGRVECF